MPGTLVLVVGPSGAGKDTLIHGAKAVLRPEASFAFPQREITRPAGGSLEPHVPVSESQFRERQANGAYALSWRAHGLGYGVPRAVDDSLAAGFSVVINVSRGIIAQARAEYLNLAVICVTVPDEVLRQRLAGRGRETEDEIAARMHRAAAFKVSGPGVTTMINDGAPEPMIARFTLHLRRVCGAP